MFHTRWLNLNDSEIRQTFDTAVHNGYIIARHKMAVFVSSTLMVKNSSSQKLEDEITTVLDQLYVNWIVKVFLYEKLCATYSTILYFHDLNIECATECIDES